MLLIEDAGQPASPWGFSPLRFDEGDLALFLDDYFQMSNMDAVSASISDDSAPDFFADDSVHENKEATEQRPTHKRRSDSSVASSTASEEESSSHGDSEVSVDLKAPARTSGPGGELTLTQVELLTSIPYAIANSVNSGNRCWVLWRSSGVGILLFIGSPALTPITEHISTTTGFSLVGDFDSLANTLKSCFATNCTLRTSAMASPQNGRDKIKGLYESILDTVPDYMMVVRAPVLSGNRVTAALYFTGETLLQLLRKSWILCCF
jgi:hypothetical protein